MTVQVPQDQALSRVGRLRLRRLQKPRRHAEMLRVRFPRLRGRGCREVGMALLGRQHARTRAVVHRDRCRTVSSRARCRWESRLATVEAQLHCHEGSRRAASLLCRSSWETLRGAEERERETARGAMNGNVRPWALSWPEDSVKGVARQAELRDPLPTCQQVQRRA